MRSLAFTLILAAALSSASADVYFEVTEHGQPPDGFESHFPFFYTGFFDVFVWGSGPDTELRLAEFDVRFTDIHGNGQIQFHALGTVDPGHLFAGPNNPGTIQPDRIDNVLVSAITGPVVPLPQGVGNALLLYSDFHMYFDGYVSAAVENILTNAGPSPVIHSIGIITTPEPAAGALLLLALVRRRR
jgi:hypothetical protein